MGGEDEPFLGSEALAAGLVSRRGLRNQFRPVYRNVYVPKEQLMTPVIRAKAAWLWAGQQATSGRVSAAAMHGSRWIHAKEYADLFRLGDAVEGINIHRDRLAADDTRQDGLRPRASGQP